MPDDTWLRADMNPDDPGSQGYSPSPSKRARVPRAVPPGEKTTAVDFNALAALAVEVRVEQLWLEGHPEWGHTELGRRFQLLLDHAKVVLGE